MADKHASYWQAAKAVFWSFFGVRKKAHYEDDAVKLTPVQVIVTGVIALVLFIFTVLGVVLLVAS